jgi:hypothetical protein
MSTSSTKTVGQGAVNGGKGVSRNTRADTKRPERVAMSGSRKRMHVPEEYQDPSFHYAWINDQGDLIPRAIRAWYEHVTVEEMPIFASGSDVDAPSRGDGLVCMNVGQGVTAYLMKQPMDAHEEDLAIQRQTNNDRLADLKRQTDGNQKGAAGSVLFE